MLSDIAGQLARGVVAAQSGVDHLDGIEMTGGGDLAMAEAISRRMFLPQTRLVIPFSSSDENDTVYDVSGQGRHFANVNGATFDVDGFAPYAELAGASNQHFSRADENGLDMSGAFTILGWVWADAAITQTPMAKGALALTAAGGYGVTLSNSIAASFAVIESGGSAFAAAANPTVWGIDEWVFVAGRFRPAVNVAAFVGTALAAAWETVVTSVASVNNNSEPFMIGAEPDGAGGFVRPFYGRVGLLSLHDTDLSDEMIEGVYAYEKELFQ